MMNGHTVSPTKVTTAPRYLHAQGGVIGENWALVSRKKRSSSQL